MKIKKFAAYVLACVMAVGMIGCANQNAPDAEKPASEKDNITIRLVTRFNDSTTQGKIFTDTLKQFEEEHPGVKIVDDSQTDESAFNNIMSTDIASGNLANIFRIQGVANLEEYINNGMLLDLTPYLEADREWADGFVEGALNYYTLPGKEGVYAAPCEGGIVTFYYNEELFRKAGIEQFPETWKELLAAVEKLRAIDVIPIALGAQSTYMMGHIHNQIFYKWLGTEGAKKLGGRAYKWTDEEVVQTVQYVKDLVDAGAFDPNAAGLTEDMAFTQFMQGDAAMIISGCWNNSKFSDPEQSPYADSVKIAKFPYFEEKPEFRNEDMQVISPYMVSGKLEGRELELTIELLKELTSKELAQKYADEAGYYLPRTDIEMDPERCGRLFTETLELSSTSTGIACDVFDFDPITSMQDRTRNSLVSLLTGASVEEVVNEIQAEIDNNQK